MRAQKRESVRIREYASMKEWKNKRTLEPENEESKEEKNKSVK